MKLMLLKVDSVIVTLVPESGDNGKVFNEIAYLL